MDLTKYGPFADIVAVAGALIATFSFLALKMLGRRDRWSRLAVEAPTFLFSAGPRALAIAIMAFVYTTINQTNYKWFAGGAIVCGVLTYLSIKQFDLLRRTHVVFIPDVGANGQPLADKHGDPRGKNVAIGSESNLRPEAADALKVSKASLVKFMSGYGKHGINNPEDLWDREVLARIANRIMASLMRILLLAVLTLYLAAFVVHIATKVNG